MSATFRVGSHEHRDRLAQQGPVPIGFKTEYDDGWVGRYQGVRTELKAIDAGVAGSYTVNEALSLGASVFAERMEVKLRDAIDFGAFSSSRALPSTRPSPGTPGARTSPSATLQRRSMH